MSSNEIEGSTRLLWTVYMVLQQLVAVLIGYTISLGFEEGELQHLWVWHKILATLGVVFIMFEGMIAFSPYNHIISDFKKSTLNYIHGCFMAIGMTLLTLGNTFGYICMEDHGHFKSLHGLFGLISWILCVIASFGGIIALYSRQWGVPVKSIYLRYSHAVIGLLAFLASLAATGLGFYKIVGETSSEALALSPKVMIVLVAILGAAAFLRTGRTVIKHTRTILTS